MVRNVQFDLENVINTLKQHSEALESKLKGTEEELELEKQQRAKLKKQVQKLSEKIVAQGKQIDKLHQDLFEKNARIQELQEEKGE